MSVQGTAKVIPYKINQVNSVYINYDISKEGTISTEANIHTSTGILKLKNDGLESDYVTFTKNAFL